MEWANSITEIFVVIVTALVTFFTTKRKYKAESESIEYKNMQTILDTYKRELEAMNKRIDDYVSKINELEKKVKDLINENVSLKGEIAGFEKGFGNQKYGDNTDEYKQ